MSWEYSRGTLTLTGYPHFLCAVALPTLCSSQQLGFTILVQQSHRSAFGSRPLINISAKNVQGVTKHFLATIHSLQKKLFKHIKWLYKLRLADSRPTLEVGEHKILSCNIIDRMLLFMKFCFKRIFELVALCAGESCSVCKQLADRNVNLICGRKPQCTELWHSTTFWAGYNGPRTNSG